MIDTIENIREQAEKIKEIVRQQEIKEKGLNNNKETRDSQIIKQNGLRAEDLIK